MSMVIRCCGSCSRAKQSNGQELKVLYALDPRRMALLTKRAIQKWREEYLPIADRLVDDHLKQIEGESRLPPG